MTAAKLAPAAALYGSDAVARLHDELAVARQQHADLLAAARAALAAEAAGLPNPSGWLRDHLAPLGLMPMPGARPTDYQPLDTHDAVWGRW
jgi:hypothetical protein